MKMTVSYPAVSRPSCQVKSSRPRKETMRLVSLFFNLRARTTDDATTNRAPLKRYPRLDLDSCHGKTHGQPNCRPAVPRSATILSQAGHPSIYIVLSSISTLMRGFIPLTESTVTYRNKKHGFRHESQEPASQPSPAKTQNFGLLSRLVQNWSTQRDLSV